MGRRIKNNKTQQLYWASRLQTTMGVMARVHPKVWIGEFLDICEG